MRSSVLSNMSTKTRILRNERRLQECIKDIVKAHSEDNYSFLINRLNFASIYANDILEDK